MVVVDLVMMMSISRMNSVFLLDTVVAAATGAGTVAVVMTEDWHGLVVMLLVSVFN